jgi:hypothetical protein
MAKKKTVVQIEEPKAEHFEQNQNIVNRFDAWKERNKTFIILGAILFFAFAVVMMLSDPYGVVPPSVNKACCDSFCAKATGVGECHRWTQEYIMCKIPENLTSTVPEINGSSPVYDFWVYDIPTVCNDVMSDA